MALDKFYGNKNKLKEFIDLCHENGIAIILDLAINHSFGRNPLVRMWMNDPDKDGWGEPSSENPYFNTVPAHTYSVGYDFNHQNLVTQEYTKQVIKYWIEEFKIDVKSLTTTQQTLAALGEAAAAVEHGQVANAIKYLAVRKFSAPPFHRLRRRHHFSRAYGQGQG